MEIYGEISKVRAAVKAWKKDGLADYEMFN